MLSAILVNVTQLGRWVDTHLAQEQLPALVGRPSAWDSICLAPFRQATGDGAR